MKTSRTLIRFAVASALTALAGGTQASGFALIEQNASGLGNAYAGAAAAAEDASTIYFNPAGMTRLPGRQFVVAGHLIMPSAKFSNTGSTAALAGFPLGTNGGDAGDPALVPNLYLSWQLDPRWFVGVGVTVPFGLATEYDQGWVGRFHALKSEIKTLNINPSVAYKVNEQFSVGAGLNWQKVEAEITKAVNYFAVAFAAGIPGVAPGTEGSNKIEGNDDAWGFNFGLMFHPTPNTNLGFSYRSAMNYTLSGSAVFAGRPAPLQAALAVPAIAGAIGDSPIDANLKMPASYSFALKHQVNPKWDVLFDATRTEWSSVKQLNIVRNTGFLLEGVPFEWKNTWRVGLGANHRYNDQWTFKGGIAYDQTPTSDAYRIPRLPDEDRTWLAFGAQYRLSKAGTLDFGYAHLFVKDPKLSLTGPPALTPALAAGRGSLVGTYDSSVDILSVQYRHNF